MRWELSFRRQALGDPVSEGRRVWAWIQQVRPLHPSLDLWRPTADSRQEAEQAPPITQDYLLQDIRDAQATSRFPSFGLAPAFSGQIGQGNKLELSFNMPNPGDAWTARCFSDTAYLGFQAALVRPRNSCSTSLGVRYPRAE